MCARILITTWGSYGDLNPYLGLARGLRERGHTPVLATIPLYRADVERENCEFRPAGPDVLPDDYAMVRRIMDPARGAEFLIRDVLMANLEPWYEELLAAAGDVDCIVGHPVTFPAPLVAERLRLRRISTVLAPMSLFSAHDLPVSPPAPWMKRLERVPGAARLLVALVKASTSAWGAPVLALRRKLGLRGTGNPIFEGQFSPFGTLALFSSVLAAPQPDWPRPLTITGQIFYDRSTGGERLAPALDAFLASGPPPAVFTLGTSAVADGASFYRESAAAASRAGLRAVLLVGRNDANRPAVLPAGTIAVDVAPHSLLFPRAAVVVHQGGAGTLGQALRSGRPQIVVPHAHDQPDNAYRVSRLGVARTVPPKRYRSAIVAAELARVTGDEPYARRAADVAQVVDSEDGVGSACRAIDALLGSEK